MYHYFVVVGGMILGLIVLAVLNKNESQKKKVKIDDQDEQTKLKEQNQYEKQESNKFEPQNTKDDMEALRQRKIESDERKNKIFKNLSVEDRQLVEEYFKKQAKQYISGEVNPADRRAAKLIQIIKFSLYVLFGLAVYISLTIAFNTTSPLMIIENLKHLVRTFLSQLFAKH
ncbi:unnamed protein product [Paramecium pentaurelia]|uniref:Uncharacterized protein n=1 Tax=Paramecium pentaurelia TaxID=43138 RepID=A0A8S1TP43_9CILI|nr:unnamed protein product [Paramecium pentaurelia]